MLKLGYAMVFVIDMERSVAFYRNMLGLPLKFQSPEWTEFATEGTTLASHHASKPSDIATVQGQMAGRCQLGFWVDDIEAFHQDMLAKEIMCIQSPREEEFGAKLAVYADPDGLPFSVAENLKKEQADQSLLWPPPVPYPADQVLPGCSSCALAKAESRRPSAFFRTATVWSRSRYPSRSVWR